MISSLRSRFPLSKQCLIAEKYPFLLYLSKRTRIDEKLESEQWHFIRSRAPTIVKFERKVPKSEPTSEEAAEENIVIPKRIPRGPTDILKALAGTVGKDYTAAHYKYHDDPFLIPASNLAKRTYSLSKESGKKAAKFILNKYPDLFVPNVAEPPMEIFMPPVQYTEDSDVTEETLVKCINCFDVDDSVIVYKALKKQGKEISNNTLKDFLELLCFYNSSSSPDEDMFEERWYRQISPKETRKQWQDNGLAEEIFLEIEKDSRTYCAMIQGTAKYYAVTRASELYQEMKEKKLPGSLDVYNAMLSITVFLKEGQESRWMFVEEILKEMNSEGIRPNLRTLNASLEVLSKLGMWRQAKSLALKTLSEFKRLGIEPSLGSYYFLLMIFCKDRGPISPILADILDEIEGKQLEIRDPKDVHFFVTAMEVCHNHLMDLQLGYRLHSLLMKQNSQMLGDSLKESIYYQNFFKLLCTAENIDAFFELYHKYVPNSYTPEPSVMQEIIEMVELNDSLQYLPQIWSDMVLFGHTSTEKVTLAMLKALQNPVDDPNLSKQFAVIAWDMKEKIDEQADISRVRRLQIQWTGAMLGDIMTVLLNADELEKAWEILFRLSRQENIIGYPSAKSLSEYCRINLKNNFADRAIYCLKYALSIGHIDVREPFSKLPETLTDAQRLNIEMLLSSALKNNENNVSEPSSM